MEAAEAVRANGFGMCQKEEVCMSYTSRVPLESALQAGPQSVVDCPATSAIIHIEASTDPAGSGETSTSLVKGKMQRLRDSVARSSN